MSGASSEEKSLPASAKKLKDARQKGQVARGADLVTAVVTVALLAYAWAGSGWIGERLRTLVLLAVDAASLPFDEALARLLPAMLRTLAEAVLPVLLIALVASVATGVLVNGGFLLALEPLKPKLENLDPVKGFKRLFGAKGLIEIVKSVLKALLFGATLVALALSSLGALVHVPFCGERCLGPVAAGMLRPLLAASAAIFVATGLADLLMQRWLFKRDMRMTQTEAKRENKDQNGNPHVKGVQRQRRREMAEGGLRLGVGQATVLVCGDAAAIGIRYVRGEVDFPTVVCRASGAAASAMIAAGRAQSIPIHWDATLSVRMAAALRLGGRITPEFFRDVAAALYASGAVR